MSNAQTPTPARRRRVVSQDLEGRISASSQLKSGKEVISETNENKSIPAPNVPADPAFIRVGVGFTENLGNFESLRVDVSLTLPCGTSDDEVREAKTRASNLVVEFIEEERTRALGQEGITSK